MKNYFLGITTVICLFLIIAASSPNSLFTIKPATPLKTKVITFPRLLIDLREASNQLNKQISILTDQGFIVKSVSEHKNLIIVILEKY